MTMPNQVAIVTGASSGIGWELAKSLANDGYKVGLVARRHDRLEKLAGEIRAIGGVAAYAAADVGERSQAVPAIRSLAAQLGPIDLLVANAGVGVPTLLQPMNVEQVEQMVRVNLLGVVYAIEAVLPAMLERRQGHLVAISSLASYKGLPGESGYCATKAAVNTYMEGLRIHAREHGITVTTVCPGFVHTEMTAVNDFKMPWVINADQAARMIVRALRHKPKVYNFPWQTTLLMRMTRWLPDWVMARGMRQYNIKPPMPPA